jgi:hypothetical protein
MVLFMLDISKKVFLSRVCIEDQKILDHVMKILEGHQVSKDRIIKDIDMDILASGDYLIRCLGSEIKLYEVRLTLPFGMTTHFVESLK